MLVSMDWKTTVTEILDWSGLSEADVASRVGTTQPTINRIKRGVTKTPTYDVGDALRRMHKSELRKRQRSGRAAA